MKVAEIKELTVAELQERIITDNGNLQKAKMNHSISPAEDTTQINKLRKDIARMETILAQKK